MSHEVETMAYTNQVPWHGLGQYVGTAKSVKEMMRIAGLNWKVEKRPLYLQDGTLVSDFSALVRDKDGAQLDVVGKAYVPTQNHEGFEVLNDFINAGGGTMETCGSLRGGRYVWGLAKLKGGFTLPGKDHVEPFLLVALPHQQGKAVINKWTATRVVCWNTYSGALAGDNEGVFRFIHRRAFDAVAREEAKETLGLAVKKFDEFGEQAAALKKRKVKDEDALEYFEEVYGVTKKGEEPKRVVQKLLEVYHAAPGADPGTAWGVFNAVTYYADHLASRTPDKRLTNAWFGKTSVHKRKMLDLLLAK